MVATITQVVAATSSFLSVDDGSANNRVELDSSATNKRGEGVVSSGGATQADIVSGADAWADGVAKSAAIAWDTNDAELVTSGVSRGTDSSVVLPVGMNRVNVGANAGQGTQAEGNLARVMVFFSRLAAFDLVKVR